MNFGETYISKKKIIFSVIGLIILITSLGVGVYLVQVRQVLKSKAATNIVDAFQMTDAQGKTISCNKNTTPPTCTTGSLDIEIKVKDLELLLK